MHPRQWGHRFVVWGNKNPFTMAVFFDLIIVAAGLGAFQIQNQRDLEQTKTEAKARAAALSEVTIQTCKAVVVTVTEQSRADDLATIRALREGLNGTKSNAVTAALLAAENKILERRAPTGACEPKENP